MSTLKNIPGEEVPDVVRTFMLSGKSNITVEQQSDGLWTVRGR